MGYIKEDLVDENEKYYIGLNNVENISINGLAMLCQQVSAYNQKKAKIFYKHKAIMGENVSEKDCTLMGYQMKFGQSDIKHDIEIRVE